MYGSLEFESIEKMSKFVEEYWKEDEGRRIISIQEVYRGILRKKRIRVFIEYTNGSGAE